MNQGMPVRIWMVHCSLWIRWWWWEHSSVPLLGSGGSAAGPVGDVVGLAPGRGDGALREGAALVPGRDGLADVRREDPGGAADVQDLALAAEHDRDDVGVAGDFADGATAVTGPVNSSDPGRLVLVPVPCCAVVGQGRLWSGVPCPSRVSRSR